MARMYIHSDAFAKADLRRILKGRQKTPIILLVGDQIFYDEEKFKKYRGEISQDEDLDENFFVTPKDWVMGWCLQEIYPVRNGQSTEWLRCVYPPSGEEVTVITEELDEGGQDRVLFVFGTDTDEIQKQFIHHDMLMRLAYG